MLLSAEHATWATDYPVLAVVVGLVGLVAGAELLVRGAVWIALSLGMSQMAVGLTLVSIGTSLPELLVTLTAADDHADLAMGNVMGSNIANILLIVGVMLLSEGGHLAHIHLGGYPIEAMSKTTFYFSIGVLVLVDIAQARYQKKLDHERAASQAAH